MTLGGGKKLPCAIYIRKIFHTKIIKRKKLLTGISKTSWVSSSIWTLMGTCRPGGWPGGRRPGSSVDTPKLSGAPSLCPAVDDLSAGSAMVTDTSSWAAGTWVHVWWRTEELAFIPGLFRSFAAFSLLQDEDCKGFQTLWQKNEGFSLKTLSLLCTRKLWSTARKLTPPPPHTQTGTNLSRHSVNDFGPSTQLSQTLLDVCIIWVQCVTGGISCIQKAQSSFQDKFRLESKLRQ